MFLPLSGKIPRFGRKINWEAYNWGEWSLVRQHYTFLEHKHSTLQREGCRYTRSRWRVLEPDNIPLKRQSFPRMALLLEPLGKREGKRKKEAFFHGSLTTTTTTTLFPLCPPWVSPIFKGVLRKRGRERERKKEESEVVMMNGWMRMIWERREGVITRVKIKEEKKGNVKKDKELVQVDPTSCLLTSRNDHDPMHPS